MFSFTVLFMLFLTNCKDKDPAPSQDLIIGTWRASSVLVEGVADGADYSAFRWVFRADGTYQFTLNFGLTEEGRWTRPSDTQLILDDGSATRREGTINNLTLTNFDWQLKTKKFKQNEVLVDYKLIP